MFKKSLILASLLCASLSAVAADTNYKTPDGQSFSTRNVYLIEGNYAGGFLRVSYVNGGENLFQDPSGSVMQKILQTQPEFTQVSGTARYVNPTYAARVSCSNGRSTVSLQNSGITVTANDGCAMSTLIYNKAK